MGSSGGGFCTTPDGDPRPDDTDVVGDLLTELRALDLLALLWTASVWSRNTRSNRGT